MYQPICFHHSRAPDLEVARRRGGHEPQGHLFLPLTGDERFLSLRNFDEKVKRRVYERQKGICVKCKKHFDISEMEADHITPWREGGKTNEANCQLLCQRDNRSKGGR